LDFARRVIIVREGKGGKDRVVMLPDGVRAALQEQLRYARALWESDRQANLPGVYLPHALEKKYPRAGQTWAWQ
jgi:site-specific recombinase XerD